MRAAWLLLFLLSGMFLLAQEKKDTSVINTHTLYSTILEENRFIDVYAPSPGKSSPRSREVIYLLDGAAHFTTVIDLLKQLAEETGNPSFTQKIVVGIGNIWTRDRDYTPTQIASSPFVNEQTAKVSGGGKKFIAFLEKELIPYIDSAYRPSSSRILIGHSLGGLIAIDMLLNNPALFSKYAAIDPSMWWDEQQLVKRSEQLLAQNPFNKNTLFLAIANTRDKDISNVSQLKKDTSTKTALIRPSLLLADHIKASKQNKLLFDWKYYKDSDHMSVFRPATYDALKFLLSPVRSKQ